jgi:hypothetical protein
MPASSPTRRRRRAPGSSPHSGLSTGVLQNLALPVTAAAARQDPPLRERRSYYSTVARPPPTPARAEWSCGIGRDSYTASTTPTRGCLRARSSQIKHNYQTNPYQTLLHHVVHAPPPPPACTHANAHQHTHKHTHTHTQTRTHAYIRTRTYAHTHTNTHTHTHTHTHTVVKFPRGPCNTYVAGNSLEADVRYCGLRGAAHVSDNKDGHVADALELRTND